MRRIAGDVLSASGISIGQDFDSLTTDQLLRVRKEAATVYARKYDKPLSSDNWAFVRKRYNLLQQRAGALRKRLDCAVTTINN